MRACLLSLLLCLLSPIAWAQAPAAPPPAPCSGPEHRQMDFWLGRWAVRWAASPGQPAGSGTNTLTREFDGCVVRESFQGGGGPGALVGMSVSSYQRARQQWRQTWVDNQGGYIELAGGKEGEHFVLMTPLAADQRTRFRMRFEDIQADSLTWRWQRSQDAGATWQDQWVILYTRLAP